MWFILRIQVASRRDDISNMRWDEVIFEGICLGSLRVNFCAGSTSTRLKKRQAFLDCACVFYPSMLGMPWGRGWAVLFRSCFSKKKPKHQNPKQNKTRPHPTKKPNPKPKETPTLPVWLPREIVKLSCDTDTTIWTSTALWFLSGIYPQPCSEAAENAR